MTASALRALVLDFDGVILESNDVKTESFREVFARFPEHAEAMMRYHTDHVSVSRFAKLEHLVFERLGRPGDRALVEELAADFSRRTRARTAVCRLVPGASEFLAEFAPKLPLYLASVTPEEELADVLVRRDLRRFFVRVFGCPPWTKPGAVAAILEEVGGADGVALVGDSAGDQRAAREAGIEFIARDSGLPFDEPGTRACRDMFAVADLVRPRVRL